jgi:hypothetical protein
MRVHNLPGCERLRVDSRKKFPSRAIRDFEIGHFESRDLQNGVEKAAQKGGCARIRRKKVAPMQSAILRRASC